MTRTRTGLRAAATEALEPTLVGLWKFLHTEPICNDITVYGSIMVPSLNLYGSGNRLGVHEPSILSGFD